MAMPVIMNQYEQVRDDMVGTITPCSPFYEEYLSVGAKFNSLLGRIRTHVGGFEPAHRTPAGPGATLHSKPTC